MSAFLRIMRYPHVKLVAIAALLCLVAYGTTYAGFTIYDTATAVPLSSLETCFATSTDPTYASTCLHSTIGALLKQYTEAQIMDYTEATSSAYEVRFYCHPIGHVLGAESFKRTNSIEASLDRCSISASCRFACAHGVIGAGVEAQLGEPYEDDDIAHSSAATIERLGTGFCNRSISLCHAIGHLLFMNEGQDAGLPSCNRVTPDGFKQEVCYQGVFMERGGGADALNPFSATSSYATRKNDYLFPCTSIAERYRHACFQFLVRYQLPLFKADGVTATTSQIALAARTCMQLSAQDRSYCFEGLGLQTHEFGINSRDSTTFCDQFGSGVDAESCMLGIIPQKIFFLQQIENEEAFAYCYGITDRSHRKVCYDATFQWLGLSYSDDRIAAMCAAAGDVCAHLFDAHQKERATLPDYRFGLFGVPKTQ